MDGGRVVVSGPGVCPGRVEALLGVETELVVVAGRGTGVWTAAGPDTLEAE